MIAPILVLPNFTQAFDLHSNTLKIGIGVVLSQNGQFMAFFNDKLSNVKLYYNTYDVEFYVVVQAV